MDNIFLTNLQTAKQKNITEQYEIQDRLGAITAEQGQLKARLQLLQNEELQLKGALFAVNTIAESEKEKPSAAETAPPVPQAGAAQP